MNRFLIVSLAAIGAVLLSFVLVACSLIEEDGSDAPEVASLASNSRFQAELVLPEDDGYVLAGVAGEAEPGDDRVCNSRFALVTVGDDGVPRRAVVASGPERDRFCAADVSSTYRLATGEWIVSGSANRFAPSGFVPGPATDHETYALRLSADGKPDTTFGDRGLVRRARVIGRTGDALVTELLERVTDGGEVRDDLVSRSGPSVANLWSLVFDAEDDFVAVDTGELSYQVFVADRSHSPVRFDALPEASLELPVLGDRAIGFHEGRLYVVQRAGYVISIDPRARRVVRSFGRRGRASLGTSKLFTDPALAVDARGRIVVAFATVDRVHGSRLYARRFARDGSPDPSYGGLVEELGRDGPLSDFYVSRVVIDGAGRAVVLDGLNAIRVRLTPGGRLDPSFGGDGIVSEPIVVCELPPARSHAACRGR